MRSSVVSSFTVAPSLLIFGTKAEASNTIRGQLGDLPLAFEENRGQLPGEVRFRAQGDGFVVAERNPFTASSSDADSAQIGDDQVIPVSFGTEFRGSATIDDVPEQGVA